jgi:hypothetical protein
MKKIFARIGIELVVSDQEANEIIEEAGYYKEGNHKANNEYEINMKFAKRFVEGGKLVDDSYIPEDSIEEA